jgi:hypothetical protein
MIKKIFIASIALSTSSFVFASSNYNPYNPPGAAYQRQTTVYQNTNQVYQRPMPPRPTYKGEIYKDSKCAVKETVSLYGPYFGVSIGAITNSGDTSFRGITGQLFAGYGALINSFYIAGELFGTPGTAKVNDRSTSSATSLRTTYDYGASLLLGGAFNDKTIGYVRGGGVATRFRSQNNCGCMQNGWQVGIGGQTNIVYPYLDVRGEYVYSHYKNVSSAVGNVNSDRVNVGLVFKFF